VKKGKDINYYLNLPWEIKIKRIPEEEGGGWVASIPLLGEWTCIGDGDTREEALKELDERLKKIIKDYLKKGIEIPEPKEEEEKNKEYSGRILLRIPAQLHYILAKQAELNKMSLNSYLVYLLSLNLGLDFITKQLNKINDKISKLFKEETEELEVVEFQEKIKKQISDKHSAPNIIPINPIGKDNKQSRGEESDIAA